MADTILIRNLLFKLKLFILFLLIPSFAKSTIYKESSIEKEIQSGSSKAFYLYLPSNNDAIYLINVEAQFEYTATENECKFLSARFNKNTDPYSYQGVELVRAGTLPAGTKSTTEFVSFNNWNNQPVSSPYYFRFFLTRDSPNPVTIHKIIVRVTYEHFNNVHVSTSTVDSMVSVGDEINVSFTLQETDGYQVIFDEIFCEVLNYQDTVIYVLENSPESVTIEPNSEYQYSGTVIAEGPLARHGTYMMRLMGRFGNDSIYFDPLEGAQNPITFEIRLGFAQVAVSTVDSMVSVGDEINVSFTLQETDGYRVTFDEIFCEVLDFQDTVIYVLENSPDSITIEPNGEYQYNGTVIAEGPIGKHGPYMMRLMGRLDDQTFWFDHLEGAQNPIPFGIRLGFAQVAASTVDSMVSMGDEINVSFTLQETDGYRITFDEIFCEVLDFQDTVIYVLENSPDSITIEPNGEYQYSGTIIAEGPLGKHGPYMMRLMGRLDDQTFWFDHLEGAQNPIPFEIRLGFAQVAVCTVDSMVSVGDEINISFTLQETDGYRITFDEIFCEVLDFKDTVIYILEHSPESITIEPNGEYQYNGTVIAEGPIGKHGPYMMRLMGRLDDQTFWFDHLEGAQNPIPFEIRLGFAQVAASTVDSMVSVGDEINVSFTLQETDGYRITFDEIFCEVLNHQDTVIYVLENSPDSITIEPNGEYQYSGTVIAEGPLGKHGPYMMRLMGRLDDQTFWFDHLEGAQNPIPFEINEPKPDISITASPHEGIVPFNVEFTLTNTGGPVTDWSWTFGDGESSTDSNPTHRYIIAGNLTATCIAIGPGGTDEESIVITAIPNLPPVVSDISDQSIGDFDVFTTIYLDEHVEDPDNYDNELTWTYFGNNELLVAIDVNRIATITKPNGTWRGSESIIFTATDPKGLYDSDEAIFTVTSSDTLPPQPNPLTWAKKPEAISISAITMIATAATDPSDVEYFFECISVGGHSSGWQDSPSYTDEGLHSSSTFAYRVKSRDKSIDQNETGYSEIDSATTYDKIKTLGNTDTLPLSTPTETRRAMPYIMPEDGTLKSVAIYHEGGSGKVLLGVYDGESLPENRLGISTEEVVYTETGWQTIPLVEPTFITEGTTIWLAWVFENSTEMRYDEGSPGRAYSSANWSDGMSPSFGNSSIANYIFSIYTNYIPWEPTPDYYPPTPDPMTWLLLPETTGPTTVTMTATTAIDSSEVEYYFECVTGGGNNSGWQTDPIYTDVGLIANTSYSYRVKARDKSSYLNETGWSSTEKVTTSETDIFPPRPDPLTWKVLPEATGPKNITMTATTASDPSGLEYYFECLTNGGHSSGWQDSSSFTDYNLYPLTTFYYRVKSRDKSNNQNETEWSNIESETTPDNIKVLGNSEVFSQVTTTTTRRAMPYVMPEDGTIKNIAIYHEGGSGKLLLGVYNGENLPLNRLGETNETVINSGAGWQIVDLVEPVLIAAGTTIWLAWVFENNPGIHYMSGSPGRANSNKYWADGMPSSFGNSSTSKYIYSIYANYSPWEPPPDYNPPEPNPMSWNTLPSTTGPNTITMTATTATDLSEVEYYFSCVSGDGNSSNWQNEPVYTDTGLQSNTSYSYQVKARDKSINQNETEWSTIGSATTSETDLYPPLPNPLTWENVPSPTGYSTITMTATTATDPSGVEYYFECTSGGGNSSGWQREAIYTNTGLAANTSYTYMTKARDRSIDQNETNWSEQATATTSNNISKVGNVEVYGTISTSAARRAMPFSMPKDGTIQSISIYHEGGSGKILLGVYNGAKSPADRLAVTNETMVNSDTGWQTITLIEPIYVPAGTIIWLAWVFEDNPGIRYMSGSPGRANSNKYWDNGLPPSFGSSNVANYIYSIYANYITK